MQTSDYTRTYSYEEIRDFAAYIARCILDYKNIELYRKNKLVLKQMGVFENLLLEAITHSDKRESCIYLVVCADMIWQITRTLLGVSGTVSIFNEQNDVLQLYIDIEKKVNLTFGYHSYIRHPTEHKMQEYGWILDREWKAENYEIVRNIGQILYKVVMISRMILCYETPMFELTSNQKEKFLKEIYDN